MDPLAVVRDNFAAFQEGDFDAALEKVDERWTYDPSPLSGAPGVLYCGHAGWNSLLDVNGWREGEVKLDVEMSRVDQYVMAAGSVSIRTPDGDQTERSTASLHLVRNDRILMSRGFAEEREALDELRAIVDPEFRLAFDAAPDPMALLDDDGRIVHANRATAALLGLPQSELRGQRIDRFAPPELHDQVLEIWERFKREGEAGGMGAVLDPDGRRRLLEFRASSNYVDGRHLVIGRRRDSVPRRNGQKGVLTPRQREVLNMLAVGLNGPEAAQRLFVSPATVRTHVQNAMHALGAKTRAQAVAEALRRGELEPPGSRADRGPGDGP